MKSHNLNSVWDTQGSWNLKEDYLSEGSDKSIVDGQNVLAIVEGICFVPNGKSRNNRYYPETLWRKALAHPEVSEKLSNKTMFGCIGHEDKPVCESDITEGKVSHIVTDLWIDESVS